MRIDLIELTFKFELNSRIAFIYIKSTPVEILKFLFEKYVKLYLYFINYF